VTAGGRTGQDRGVLVVFGGLPATGKTSLSRAVAESTGASYVRIDAVEAALIRVGLVPDQAALGPAGYVVAGAVVDSGLSAGCTVVVDAVNPVEAARAAWRQLAERHGVPLLFVEVTCSDEDLHRQRAQARTSDLAEITSPTWEQISVREYEPWTEPHLVIDNIGPLLRHTKRVVNAMQALTGE
jgi:predicted kinase